MKKIKNRSINNRIVWVYSILGFLLAALMIRLAHIQIINSDFYEKYASSQQTWDTVIEAKRGNIYDRNGKELATSVRCYTLTVVPNEVKKAYTDEQKKQIAKDIAEITNRSEDAINAAFDKKTTRVTVFKKITEEEYLAIKALKYTGIELTESVMRYYPFGNFLSQVLGSINDDGDGRSGLELQYDEYLSGISGRWVKQTDVSGNELIDGTAEYYEAQDGYNVVTTIDSTIQYFVEKAIAESLESSGAKRVTALVMNPKTGEILASASTGGFNPNNPTVPDDEEEKEKFSKLSAKEKTAYLAKLWRNPVVSDTYEPGSTFKPLVASAALQEGVVSTSDIFECSGSTVVSGIRIHCAGWSKHGKETIKEAIGNSCNVAFINIATKLGRTKLYKYFDLYGITEKTGVDVPAESSAIMYKESQVGPVELATMGYGQSISITPIQMLTVLNTIANDGVSVKPRYVSELTDDSGNTIKAFGKEEIRRVISKETAEYIKSCLQYAVEHGSGGLAKIPGYKIGGKTGTATKIEEGTGQYGSTTIASFMAIAPLDDPKVSIIVVLDSPTKNIYGSAVAAPLAKTILTDTLSYLGIDPVYSEAELKKIQSKYTTVPNVVGEVYSDAIGILGGQNLTYSKSESIPEEDDFKIVAQYPEAGTKVEKGTAVYLYRE